MERPLYTLYSSILSTQPKHGERTVRANFRRRSKKFEVGEVLLHSKCVCTLSWASNETESNSALSSPYTTSKGRSPKYASNGLKSIYLSKCIKRFFLSESLDQYLVPLLFVPLDWLLGPQLLVALRFQMLDLLFGSLLRK